VARNRRGGAYNITLARRGTRKTRLASYDILRTATRAPRASRIAGRALILTYRVAQWRACTATHSRVSSRGSPRIARLIRAPRKHDAAAAASASAWHLISYQHIERGASWRGK